MRTRLLTKIVISIVTKTGYLNYRHRLIEILGNGSELSSLHLHLAILAKYDDDDADGDDDNDCHDDDDGDDGAVCSCPQI